MKVRVVSFDASKGILKVETKKWFQIKWRKKTYKQDRTTEFKDDAGQTAPNSVLVALEDYFGIV